jgi:WD40 repeat protein/transcriptional regulator with XRE-family HTH domain
MDEKRKFHELLEMLREKRGISKKELAMRTGLSNGYISLLTRGVRETPSEIAVKLLADSLDLDQELRTQFFTAAGYSNYQIQLAEKHEESILTELAYEEATGTKKDYAEAPDIRTFLGRQKELEKLKEGIVTDRSRLVAIFGIGGVGKTMLATREAQEIESDFEYIFWRSLQSAPPLKTILERCIRFISPRRSELPENEDEQILTFIEYLRKHRCLLILDNFESILEAANTSGNYRQGYEGYGKFLLRIGESNHESCLLITTREKPKEIIRLEGRVWPIRSLHLNGMKQNEARPILEEEGVFGDEIAWEKFISLYAGNPFAMKLVSASIRELFGGNIQWFLDEGEAVFGDIQDLLEQQLQRLSEQERRIIYWLAIEYEAVDIRELKEDIVPAISVRALQEALELLRRRSMIEITTSNTISCFTLLPIIREYIREKIIDEAYHAITQCTFGILERHALVKAQDKDYIRNTQTRLFLHPLKELLLTTFGKQGSEQLLRTLLSTLQKTRMQKSDYAAGNILNLLLSLEIDLTGYDFSHLNVSQAYLQEAELRDVNFAYSNLEKSTFRNTFGNILAVAASPKEDLIAAGTASGEVVLWSTSRVIPHFIGKEHTEWIKAVAFSPDGRILASGSMDKTIRLWDVETGTCLPLLLKHENWIRTVAFRPGGGILASGDDTGKIYLWQVETGELITTLQGHEKRVYSIAFTPDGSLLASSSEDQTIRVWDVQTYAFKHTFSGHQGWVEAVAINNDGSLLASAGYDHTIRLWNLHSGTLYSTFYDHEQCVRSVAFSRDGETLASGSDDHTIRLWNVKAKKCSGVLEGHTSGVRSVTFNSNGQLLISGSDDQTVRLWEVVTQESLKTLQGYSSRVYAIAVSPDGSLLASTSDDRIVRLWDIPKGPHHRKLPGYSRWSYSIAFSPDGSLLASGSEDSLIHIWNVKEQKELISLSGHENWVKSVAFSPDGTLLVSGSDDKTVRLWSVHDQQSLGILGEHKNWVRAVAFSPDSTLVASGSNDRGILVWNVQTRRCIKELRGHERGIYSIAFHPAGKLLASAGIDQTIRLWDIRNGTCLRILKGHEDWIWSVAFSPDGTLLASGSEDQRVCLWDVQTGTLLKTLQGHDSWVQSVAFDPQGYFLTSGSHDGTVKLWEVKSGQCLRTMSNTRPYEGMNITGVQGMTDAQKKMLKELGAFE